MSSKLTRQAAAAAVCFAAAISAVGCGGVDEEAEIRETVRQFIADDTRRCDLLTDRLLRNSEDEPDLAAARRSCRKDESGPEDDSEPEFLTPAEGGETTDVEVDGDQADARVTLRGGDLDGQEVVFKLKRVDGWKVDFLDGLEIDDRLRGRFEQLIRESLSGGSDVTPRQTSRLECILERLRESFPNERIAEVWEGQHPPGTFERTVGDAMAACLEGSARGVGAGSAYRVTVPGGWQDVTEVLGPSFESGLNRSAVPKPTVDLVLAETARFSSVSAFVTLQSGLPADLTLAQYLEDAGVRGRPDRTTLGGVDAVTFEPSPDEDSRQRQVVALRDRVAYVVTFTADEQHFDDGAERFEAMLAAWQWE